MGCGNRKTKTSITSKTWDLETERIRWNPETVSFSPNGRILIIDYKYFWDMENMEPMADTIGLFTEIAFSSDGSQLATGKDDETIYIWELSR